MDVIHEGEQYDTCHTMVRRLTRSRSRETTLDTQLRQTARQRRLTTASVLVTAAMSTPRAVGTGTVHRGCHWRTLPTPTVGHTSSVTMRCPSQVTFRWHGPEWAVFTNGSLRPTTRRISTTLRISTMGSVRVLAVSSFGESLRGGTSRSSVTDSGRRTSSTSGRSTSLRRSI